METSAGQFQRVLLALEDLATQEELLVNADEFAGLASLQERMAPLVECLASSTDVADPSLRQRVTAVIERRARSEARLIQNLAQVRAELLTIHTSRKTIAQVMPAYRQPTEAAVNGQLYARG